MAPNGVELTRSDLGGGGEEGKAAEQDEEEEKGSG